MTHIQKEIQRKLQIEQQTLSVRLKEVQNQEMSDLVNPVDIQMHDRLKVRLASIERAFLRLEKGTFGVCQSCGEEIDNARLEVLPYAEQCIYCQRKLEQKIIRLRGYAYA